jgi:hypothetical protein
MTKAELLADLADKCGGEVLSTDLVDTTGLVKRYVSTIFTVGEDAVGIGIADKREVSFFVYDEGEETEVAYYSNEGYRNSTEQNPTGSTLLAIYGIFSNPRLRERVTASIVKAIRAKMAGTPSDADKKIAKAFVTDLNGLIDLFMSYVASNATIQSNGGAATDSDLDYVVQNDAEAWPKVGAALSV